jgi:hypothetical protein
MESGLERMARDAATRHEALIALLEIHKCNSRPDITVSRCVAAGLCRCSCELFIDPTSQERK